MTTNTKFVRFDIWCKHCVYKNTSETDDPCNDCLIYGANENSTKPVCFKPEKDTSIADALKEMRY